LKEQGRWKRPTVVFLDGDQSASAGCSILPGDEAPERVVFAALHTANWPDVASHINRGASETIDALNRVLPTADHHGWVRAAADELVLGSDILWQALCAAYAKHCATKADKEAVVIPIEEALAAA